MRLESDGLAISNPGGFVEGVNINTVIVHLSSAAADADFLRMILEVEERNGTSMPIDALIVLARLRKERRLSASEAAKAIQKEESAARSVLERLTESGLVEAHGVKKGRTYTLSANVYRTLGHESRYVRQAGFDPIQQEQMVVQYLRKHGRMKRQDAVDLCHIGPFQATRLLNRLVKSGKIKRQGKKRGSYYVLDNNKQKYNYKRAH